MIQSEDMIIYSLTFIEMITMHIFHGNSRFTLNKKVPTCGRREIHCRRDGWHTLT